MRSRKHKLSIHKILMTGLVSLMLGGCITMWLGEGGKEATKAFNHIVSCEHVEAIAELELLEKSPKRIIRAVAYFTHAVALEDMGKRQESLKLYPNLLQNGYENKNQISEDITDGIQDLRKERRKKFGKSEC